MNQQKPPITFWLKTEKENQQTTSMAERGGATTSEAELSSDGEGAADWHSCVAELCGGAAWMICAVERGGGSARRSYDVGGGG